MNVVRPPDSAVSERAGGDGIEKDADEPVLSIADAGRALGLGAATVRRYLADHACHVATCRRGRRTLILLRSFPALARIRDLRRRRGVLASLASVFLAPASSSR